MNSYSIYHPNLLDSLFRDEVEENHWLGQRRDESHEDFFVNFVNYNYNVFARPYSCLVKVHVRRTVEALDIFLDDSARALKKLHMSTELDEFKTAGFLAYWLRRRCVVDAIELAGPRDSAVSPTNLQMEFIKYGNEICAFNTGFHFCLRFQAKSEADARKIRVDYAFIRETAAFMSTKNVSPHSLYLIYRALFLDLRS